MLCHQDWCPLQLYFWLFQGTSIWFTEHQLQNWRRRNNIRTCSLISQRKQEQVRTHRCMQNIWMKDGVGTKTLVDLGGSTGPSANRSESQGQVLSLSSSVTLGKVNLWEKLFLLLVNEIDKLNWYFPQGMDRNKGVQGWISVLKCVCSSGIRLSQGLYPSSWSSSFLKL